MMKISTAEFIISVAALGQLPVSKLPEIAFLGRSNVGKSSLINSLCNRKALAKTSSQPGKTRVINYYRINGNIYFVDLPGYGYAKVPDKIRSGWRHLIEGYLKSSKRLKLGLIITDARHEPTKLDVAMIKWLDFYKIPYGLILTKSDKIPRHKLQQRVNDIQNTIQRGSTLCRAVLPYSSVKGDGKPELMKLIDQVIHNESNTHASNT
jgi:GTP-binding protein